jgi:branched-chain amino acid transport system substrate-binding protein
VIHARTRKLASRRTARAVSLFAVVALAAAACGGDDDAGDDAAATTAAAAEPTTTAAAAETTVATDATDEAPTTTEAAADEPTTTAAAAEATGTPLRIGLLNDQSGPSSGGQKEAAAAAEAWADEVNANGGVAGHPVELVIKDTRGDAPTGSAAAQELIDDTSVIATLVVDANAEAAYGPSLSQGGLPVIGGAGYNPTFWGALPNVWGIATSFPSVVNEQVIAAASVGATKGAVAACAEVAACASAAPVFEGATKALGLEYGGVVTIAFDAPDFTAECLQFINDGVDFVQLSATAGVVQRLAADCQTQGYDGWFGASAGTVNPNLFGGDVELKLTGGLNGFPWFVDDAPVQAFRDVMEAHGIDEDGYSMPTVTATYASLELFKKTLEANAATLGDNPDRAALVAAYGTVADETLDGLLPNPVTFTADAPGPPISCFWLYTFEDGEFSGEFEPTCPGPEFG